MESASERRMKIIDYIRSSTIYAKFKINEDDFEVLKGIFVDAFTFRLFCVACNDESIFMTTKKERVKKQTLHIPVTDYSMDEKEPTEKSYRSNKMEKFANEYPFAMLSSICADCGLAAKFYFLIKNNSIMKIGQYPSIRDLGIKEISKYRSLLQNEYNDYDEFCAALHIFASGAVVGAFVYLRRILEHLIDEAHRHAKEQDGWDEQKYKSGRYGVKIKMLKNELPKHTHECLPDLYGILSKGIHELSEYECKKRFDLVKHVIITILEEKLKRENELKIQDEAKKILNKIRSEI